MRYVISENEGESILIKENHIEIKRKLETSKEVGWEKK